MAMREILVDDDYEWDCKGRETGIGAEIVLSTFRMPECEEVSRALAWSVGSFDAERWSLKRLREDLIDRIDDGDFDGEGEKRVRNWIAAAEWLWEKMGWDETEDAFVLPAE